MFAGLRYETGWDWQAYQEFLTDLSTEDSLYQTFGQFPEFEKGFIIFSYVVKSLGGGLQTIFLLMAMGTVALMLLSFKKYTPFFLVAILIYLYNGYPLNFGYIRQGISVAIFTYAIRYIESREALKYFCLFFIAVLFHTSAILFVPFYFILNKSFKHSVVVIAIVVSFLFSYLDWMGVLLSLFDVFLGGNLAFAKLHEYYLRYTDVEEVRVGLSTVFFERLFVFLYFSYNKQFFSNRIKYFNVFYNLMFGYFCMYLLFIDIAVLLERIGLYFDIANIFMYSFLLFKITKGYKRVFMYNLITLVIFLRLYRFFYQQHPLNDLLVLDLFYPYKNYLLHLMGLY